MNQLFVDILIRQNLIPFYLVQFCRQTAGAEGKFDEEAPGGNHDKDGCFGKRSRIELVKWTACGGVSRLEGPKPSTLMLQSRRDVAIKLINSCSATLHERPQHEILKIKTDI